MRKRTALLGTLALGLALAGPSAAREIYVSRDGKNSNPGTKEAPIKSLWKVVGDLQEGDVVRVTEGVYPGQSKSGVMPKGTASNVVLEGGWKADFSERDPFKYLTIIAPPDDVQGKGGPTFHFEGVTDVTIDGFCIDKGPHNYYFQEGEIGPNKKIEGHVDNTCWGYRAMNIKKSGSDPTITLIGRGSFTVRNNLLVNTPWWGIYVKGGGEGTITIENNLVLSGQGRGIEAITGGGWGKPTWVIRNNTVAFITTIGSTEGRALSADPREGYGKYVVEKNVFAFNDGSGISCKFGAKGQNLAMTDNLFYFNGRADFGQGGSATANAADFEDELECENEENVHEMPKFMAKMSKSWFDRWSLRYGLCGGMYRTWEELKAARDAMGLGAYEIATFEKTFPDYASLPKERPSFDKSRYPRPMKKGEGIDWAADVLPLLGQDGGRGVQAGFAK